jgi:hypothetical protein
MEFDFITSKQKLRIQIDINPLDTGIAANGIQITQKISIHSEFEVSELDLRYESRLSENNLQI